MIKRIACLILTAIMLYALAACMDNEDEDLPPISANELAGVILNSIEFPKMTELTEINDISRYTYIYFNDEIDFCFYWQAMSVDLAEIVIAVTDNNEECDDIYSQLNDRLTNLRDNSVFYPNQQAAVNGAVLGKKNNVVYLICHEEADKAEEALLQLI